MDHHEAPDWSRTGLIAYRDYGIVRVYSGSVRVDTALAGLWVLTPATGEKRRLLPYKGNPDWSWDGSRIALDIPAISTVNADGTGFQILVRRGRSFFPSWRGDGQWIAFDSYTYGLGYHIWAVRPDGSELYQVTSWYAGARDPGWSPDGARIAHRRGPSWEIYTMGPHGEDPRRVTLLGADTRYPEYSPDGMNRPGVAGGSIP